MTRRDCGGCTLCCKLVAVPALDKPQGKWCQHCQIGKGCAIQGQPERPEACAIFDCLWLQGYGTEEMRPDKSKVVMASTSDAKSLVLHVDPARPDAYRTPAFDRLIDVMIEGGGRVFIVTGDKRTMITEKS
jgi:hypothetical protein